MKNIIISIIWGLFCSLSVFSHNISVSSFKLLETDLTANTAGTMEQDQNGETAALIKVVTTQTGFSFDGGALGIVKTVQKPSEIWVYVPRGMKKITISHPQLGILRDYYYNIPIDAARTYELVLSTGTVQTIVNQDAGGQYLVMTIDPPTATVYIDDKEVSLQNGTTSKFLSYGNHTYRISDPLYLSDAGTFEIGREKIELAKKLIPAYGILHISTSPDNGAKVYLDNETEPLGITPLITKKIQKGEHLFRFQMPGYDSKTLTYSVHDDGSTQPWEVVMSSNYADITINAPQGCWIIINGEQKGYESWQGRLVEGLYRVETKKEGHSPTSQNITVVKGENQTISLMAPIPLYGGLNVNSNPIGAKIIIDGIDYGETPQILNNILAGKHLLSLNKDGYSLFSQNIIIEEGKFTEICPDLSIIQKIESSKNIDSSEAEKLFAQQKYLEAYNIYISLAEKNPSDPMLWYCAARCKEMTKDMTAYFELLNKAIGTFSIPYSKDVSPYLWVRAVSYKDLGNYQKSLDDMNTYEKIMIETVNDNFYYERFSVELQLKLFRNALDDITKAISMNPQEILYYAEKGSLEIRVGLYDQAIQTLQECIKLDSQNSDGFLFLGLAQCLKGDKVNGRKNLEIAYKLGDERAKDIMEQNAQ